MQLPHTVYQFSSSVALRSCMADSVDFVFAPFRFSMGVLYTIFISHARHTLFGSGFARLGTNRFT